MSITDQALAVEAAEAGAAVVRSHYGTSLTRFEKTTGDFATTADIEAETAILDVLGRERPDDGVLGEESGRTGPDRNGRTWLVDPLCGTLNFAVRTMLASVNVALRIGTHTAVAASADPFTGEVFWSDGISAYVRHGGVDARLVPSAGSALVDVNLDPPFPNRDVFLAARMLADDGFIGRFRPRVMSTTLAVAWVAAGRRAAYVTDGHLHDSVHFAAGIALCEAAACVVSGIDGQPVHTGRGGLVVAADQPTHAALLGLVRHQRPGARAGRRKGSTRSPASGADRRRRSVNAMNAQLLRNRWIAGSLVVVVAAVGIGLFLFEPWRLWTDHEVQDALPPESVPSATAPLSSAEPAPSSAPAADRLLRAGEFVTHEHDTSGRAQVVRRADGRHQLVLRDLDTSDGPDLRVWLTDQEVLAGKAGWDVFDDGRWVEVAELKGNRGNQVYDIPASVDLDGLRSVSIWCKRFSVSFGAAPLA